MCKVLQAAREFWESDDAATATEYAVMLALIVLVAMTAISAMGEKVSGSFASAESEFANYYP